MALRTMALLALALHGTAALGGEVLLDIPTRPGATVRVLEMTGEHAASHVVLYLAGGTGQRGLLGVWPGSLPTDPDTLYGAQRQMAQQVGAMVAVDTASDHEVLTMDDRQGSAHRQDIAAVVAFMRARHPQARIVLMGSSNGAFSAAHVANRLPTVDQVVLVNASADAWAEAPHLKRPVLGVHHKRDACLPFRDSYPKARFYPLIVADSPAFPPVSIATPRDCSRESAHGLHGQLSQVYRAIGAWLLTGAAPATIP
ncbi:alpha/beta hydrolase [Pseudoduganella violaceinigra]|uniref:alpha/beta hydrolase n=1 Tax=Pseudoduganella violaceinigra TaxID=246602 RepID=UPI001376717C|nr:alpha/beta hydrolase [Pseudoduganella violaceinigra]